MRKRLNNWDRTAVNAAPTDPDVRLTRDQLAVALSAAGYPITSATLATRVSRGEGPAHAIWGSRVYYRRSVLATGGAHEPHQQGGVTCPRAKCGQRRA
jgi:hypothetical protein